MQPPRVLLRWIGTLGLLLASALPAQTNRLTVLTMGGFPLTAPTASPTDFDAGSIIVGSTTFTVDITSSTGGSWNNRTATVAVACGAGCPGTVTNLQWRRSDLGTWNTLSATFVNVQARSMVFNGTNDPWTATMVWRYNLSWTGSPPTAAQQFPILLRMTITSP